MSHVLYVISDLHLGGAAPQPHAPGFQMCSPAGRTRLAALIRTMAAQRQPDRSVELCINGDFIDFLAEAPFSAFSSEAEAVKKLGSVFTEPSTVPVFDALRDFVSAGNRLTLLLGNHDLELSLPAVRSELVARLGHGHIEFIYDNQAYTRGPVLIEHGNAYDDWNAVDHAALRHLRSELSRRKPAPPFTPPAGSRLVIEVMNKLKGRYSFVDLLKPETEAALPLIAVLDHQQVERIDTLVAAFQTFLQRRADLDGSGVQSAPRDSQASQRRTAEARDVAQLIAEQPDGTGAPPPPPSLFARLQSAWHMLGLALFDGDLRLRKEVQSLHVALHQFAQGSARTLQTDFEAPMYLEPASAAAARGFRVVVYGHTHLLKRVELGGGALYLNTGTWADLILLPAAVLSEDPKVALPELRLLLADLRANRLSHRRGLVPSYARIEYGSGDQVGAELKLFRSEQEQIAITAPSSLLALHELASPP